MNLARLSTFPVFFGQLTGAYEGIGTVSVILAPCLCLVMCPLITDRSTSSCSVIVRVSVVLKRTVGDSD